MENQTIFKFGEKTEIYIYRIKMANAEVELLSEEEEDPIDPSLFDKLHVSSEDDEGAAVAYKEYTNVAKEIDEHYKLIDEMRELIWTMQSGDCLTPRECQEIQRLSGLIAEERISIDAHQLRMKKLENFGRVEFDEDDPDYPRPNPHLILFYFQRPLPWANKYPRPIQTKTADEICDETCFSDESTCSDSDSDDGCCSESDDTYTGSDPFGSEEESSDDSPCPKIIRKHIKP